MTPAQDLRGTAQRLSAFLGCALAPETLGALEQHCSFASMRDNTMANYTLIPPEIMDHSQGRFMRKGEGARGHGGDTGGTGCRCSLTPHCPLSPCPAGEVGDWHRHFTPQQNACFNRIYQEQMGDVELPMPWPIA